MTTPARPLGVRLSLTAEEARNLSADLMGAPSLTREGRLLLQACLQIASGQRRGQLSTDGPDPLSVLRFALTRVAAHGGMNSCENFVDTSPQTCRSPGSGRTIDAEYSADAWCMPCVAEDALERVADR